MFSSLLNAKRYSHRFVALGAQKFCVLNQKFASKMFSIHVLASALLKVGNQWQKPVATCNTIIRSALLNLMQNLFMMTQFNCTNSPLPICLPRYQSWILQKTTVFLFCFFLSVFALQTEWQGFFHRKNLLPVSADFFFFSFFCTLPRFLNKLKLMRAQSTGPFLFSGRLPYL